MKMVVEYFLLYSDETCRLMFVFNPKDENSSSILIKIHLSSINLEIKVHKHVTFKNWTVARPFFYRRKQQRRTFGRLYLKEWVQL